VLDVRRSAERFTTSTPWLTSRHSFSFGPFYDPANVAFAELVAHNDDVVAAGTGYDTHPHADLEIVTWVVQGALRHEDSQGRSGLVHPGLAQLMSAGRGIRHSERSADPAVAEPTRFVQMWLRPDESGLDPSYAQHDVSAHLRPDTLVPLVSGTPAVDAPVRIHTRDAALHVARLRSGGTVPLPDAPRLHVYVVRGSVDLEGAGRLDEGDAARLTAEGSRRLRGLDDAEVLAWQLP
jgi:quercetin 2,3-dioxygenase